MKFVVGFLAGLVVGAVGAVAYAIQSGRDLREMIDEVRSDLSTGDINALGARIESRVTEMQNELETRIAQIKERASTAVEEANTRAQGDTGQAVEVVDAVSDQAAEAAGGVADAAEPASGNGAARTG